MKNRLLSLVIAITLIFSSVSVIGAVEVADTFDADAVNDVVSVGASEIAEVSETQAVAPVTEVPQETQAPTQEPTQEVVKDYPEITSISTSSNGLKISWSEYEGAYRYRLFIKRTDGKGWKTITTTTARSYTHTNLKNNTEYIYTVRVVNKNGSFGSAYNKDGWAFTYLSNPVIKSVSSEIDGLKVSWNAVEGAENYKVYVKQTSGWKALGFTTGTTFLDKDVVSGKAYTYTIRCVTPDGKNFTSHHNSGKKGTFVATPQVTKIENVANGTKFTWNKVAGASKYKLFYKVTNGWKTIATTTGTTLTHSNLKNGDKYTYTVRACNANGSYVSAYNKTGWDNTFLSVPVLTSVSSAQGGLEVKWNAVEGAENYKVYVKQTNGWKALGFTTETYFVDTNAQSGTTYTYTVKCASADGTKNTSYHDTKGVSGSFIETPLIKAVENLENGVKVTWNKVGGVEKYKLFYKKADGSGWKTIGTTTGDNFTHADLNDGDVYTYTVRGCNSKGSYISGYDKTGVVNVFIAPIEFTSVSCENNVAFLQWNAVEGVSSYRIYRKTIGGEWELFPATTETTFVDSAAIVDAPYTYAIRALDENENPVSYYSTQYKYFLNGELANGAIVYNGTTYTFENGNIKQGYITVNGNLYYYDNSGTLLKNGIVGNDKDGYMYADKTGKIDKTVRKAHSQNGQDWIVLEGKAKKVVTEKDKTFFRALKEVDKALKGRDTSKLSKAQKLRICYDYVKDAYVEKNPRIPHYNGMDWPEIYANDMFVRGTGNCFSYGACFAYMAKAIGYEEVYACHSGGHGWAEIDGLVYDPEWSRHHDRDYYAVSYNENCGVDYKGAMAIKLPWKHIKIYE